MIHNLSKNNQSCFQHFWQGSWTWAWSSTRSGPTWCHVMCPPPQCTNNCRNSQHCTINLSSHCSVLFPVFNIFSLLIRNTSAEECCHYHNDHSHRLTCNKKQRLLNFTVIGMFWSMYKIQTGLFLEPAQRRQKNCWRAGHTYLWSVFSLCGPTTRLENSGQSPSVVGLVVQMIAGS